MWKYCTHIWMLRTQKWFVHINILFSIINGCLSISIRRYAVLIIYFNIFYNTNNINTLSSQLLKLTFKILVYVTHIYNSITKTWKGCILQQSTRDMWHISCFYFPHAAKKNSTHFISCSFIPWQYSHRWIMISCTIFTNERFN